MIRNGSGGKVRKNQYTDVRMRKDHVDKGQRQESVQYYEIDDGLTEIKPVETNLLATVKPETKTSESKRENPTSDPEKLDQNNATHSLSIKSEIEEMVEFMSPKWWWKQMVLQEFDPLGKPMKDLVQFCGC